MTDLALPWAYRPREFDDWGFIRDATGDLAACARGDKGIRSHDGHRAAGTDPYGVHAAFIVKAVNNHAALVEALEKIIEMNLQTAFDKYGDASKAESWACVAVARRVLGAVGGPAHG